MKWKFPASSAEDLLHHCQLQLLFKIQMKITRPHFEIMSVTNSWAINNLHYFTILCALWCVIMIVILHHLRRSQSAPWSLKKDNSWRSAATGKKSLIWKFAFFPEDFLMGLGKPFSMNFNFYWCGKKIVKMQHKPVLYLWSKRSFAFIIISTFMNLLYHKYNRFIKV